MGVKRITNKKAVDRKLVRIPMPTAFQQGTHTRQHNMHELAQAVSELGFPVYKDNRDGRDGGAYWTTTKGADMAEAIMLAVQVEKTLRYEHLARIFNGHPPAVAEFRAAANLNAGEDALRAILRDAERRR